MALPDYQDPRGRDRGAPCACNRGLPATARICGDSANGYECELCWQGEPPSDGAQAEGAHEERERSPGGQEEEPEAELEVEEDGEALPLRRRPGPRKGKNTSASALDASLSRTRRRSMRSKVKRSEEKRAK